MTSRTRSANARARSAYSGSSASSSAYSFIVEPQPAALTTTCSTPDSSKESIESRANACASGLAAVVHRQRAAAALARAGRRRRSPRPASTRAVAALTPGKNAPWHAAGEQADHRAPSRPTQRSLGRQRSPACRAAARAAPSPRAGGRAGRAVRCAGWPGRGRSLMARSGPRSSSQPLRVAGTARTPARAAPCPWPSAHAAARPGHGSARSDGRTAPRRGRRSRTPCSPGRRPSADHRVAHAARPRGPAFIR